MCVPSSLGFRLLRTPGVRQEVQGAGAGRWLHAVSWTGRFIRHLGASVFITMRLLVSHLGPFPRGAGKMAGKASALYGRQCERESVRCGPAGGLGRRVTMSRKQIRVTKTIPSSGLHGPPWETTRKAWGRSKRPGYQTG